MYKDIVDKLIKHNDKYEITLRVTTSSIEEFHEVMDAIAAVQRKYKPSSLIDGKPLTSTSQLIKETLNIKENDINE